MSNFPSSRDNFSVTLFLSYKYMLATLMGYLIKVVLFIDIIKIFYMITVQPLRQSHPTSVKRRFLDLRGPTVNSVTMVMYPVVN